MPEGRGGECEDTETIHWRISNGEVLGWGAAVGLGEAKARRPGGFSGSSWASLSHIYR